VTEQEWQARSVALWTAIGWHMRASKANFNVEDCVNLIAMLMCRIARLEHLQSQPKLFGLF
jgi:hypothetical protein